MQQSIALVTGATSGLGYAAARVLAGKGYREVIVTAPAALRHGRVRCLARWGDRHQGGAKR